MQYDLSAPRKRINYLTVEIDAAYHDIAAKMGLSDSATVILYVAWDQGGSCLLRDINTSCGIPKQTVNSALRKLEADGIVRLEAAAGKKKTILLTEQGKELARHTVARMMALEDSIFAGWSQEDQEKYLSLTQKYLSDLKTKSLAL